MDYSEKEKEELGVEEESESDYEITTDEILKMYEHEEIESHKESIDDFEITAEEIVRMYDSENDVDNHVDEVNHKIRKSTRKIKNARKASVTLA